MTTIQQLQAMYEDALLVIAGDHYKDIYERLGGWVETNNEIKYWARKFLTELNWKGEDDERDWLLCLEEFEEKMLEQLKKITPEQP